MTNYSLIIPIYNKEKQLPFLLSQINKIEHGNIEVIFVDDGSSDNSLTILKNFNFVNNINIKIVHQKNAGPGIARNSGLKEASGKYIWFIDSDDIINVSAFDVFDSILKCEKNLDILCFNFERTTKPDCSFNNFSFKTNSIDNKIALLFESVTPWSKLFNKNFLIKNKIKFSSYYFAEDLLFSQQAFCIADKIIKTDFVAYKYMINESSLSHTHYKEHSKDFIKICQKLKALADKNLNYKNELYYNICEHSRNFITNISEKNLYSKESEELMNYINDNHINNNTYEILENQINLKYTSSTRWKILEPLVKLKILFRKK